MHLLYPPICLGCDPHEREKKSDKDQIGESDESKGHESTS